MVSVSVINAVPSPSWSDWRIVQVRFSVACMKARVCAVLCNMLGPSFSHIKATRWRINRFCCMPEKKRSNWHIYFLRSYHMISYHINFIQIEWIELFMDVSEITSFRFSTFIVKHQLFLNKEQIFRLYKTSSLPKWKPCFHVSCSYQIKPLLKRRF